MYINSEVDSSAAGRRILFRVAVVGLAVVGVFAVMPITILYYVRQAIGRLFGRQAAVTSAADSGAAVASTAMQTADAASGGKGGVSGHAMASVATALLAPSVAAGAVTWPVGGHAHTHGGKNSRAAAGAATATARNPQHK